MKRKHKKTHFPRKVSSKSSDSKNSVKDIISKKPIDGKLESDSLIAAAINPAWLDKMVLPSTTIPSMYSALAQVEKINQLATPISAMIPTHTLFSEMNRVSSILKASSLAEFSTKMTGIAALAGRWDNMIDKSLYKSLNLSSAPLSNPSLALFNSHIQSSLGVNPIINAKSLGSSMAFLNKGSSIYNLSAFATRNIEQIQWANLDGLLKVSRYEKTSFYKGLTRLSYNYNKLLSTWYNDAQVQERYSAGIYNSPAVEFYRTSQVLEVFSNDEVAEERVAEVIPLGEAEFNIVEGLQIVHPALLRLWRGAVSALQSNNPDKCRHFCVSAREFLLNLINTLAPSEEIYKWNPNPLLTQSGQITNKAKLFYIARNVVSDDYNMFLNAEIDATLSLILMLNKGTHGVEITYTPLQMNMLQRKVESSIRQLLCLHLQQ